MGQLLRTFQDSGYAKIEDTPISKISGSSITEDTGTESSGIACARRYSARAASAASFFYSTASFRSELC